MHLLGNLRATEHQRQRDHHLLVWSELLALGRDRVHRSLHLERSNGLLALATQRRHYVLGHDDPAKPTLPHRLRANHLHQRAQRRQDRNRPGEHWLMHLLVRLLVRRFWLHRDTLLPVRVRRERAVTNFFASLQLRLCVGITQLNPEIDSREGLS